MNNDNKKIDKFIGAAIGLWVFSALASVAVTCGIIYVIWHFLMKIW